MKSTTTIVILVFLCGLAFSQPPVENFPIAELQYKNRTRLVHLHSDFGFIVKWNLEENKASFRVYDKKLNMITTTEDFMIFKEALESIPDGAEVAWVNTCGAPLYYGMPEESLSIIRDVIKQKKFKMAEIKENNFVLCICESTKVSYFKKAPLKKGKISTSR